ncbi:MAG: membrane protein insertion efficiency factor YidD [Desulfovibrio sp.]|nr:MAG: membrane protein insertion efficiency factor YidD [Desulfovibrio sp.]
MRMLLLSLVRLYKFCISPLLPPACRFEPTCSVYAAEAIEMHGAVKGSWLAAKRLVRCHPLCKGGVDPVPLPTPQTSSHIQDNEA